MDEAHSSQSGETARELKAILGAAAQAETGEDEPDWGDRLNQIMQSRGHQPNLSFFAFTATPKGKTLELFGRKGASGLPEAFHLYSMRQAIEEGFNGAMSSQDEATPQESHRHHTRAESQTQHMVKKNER